MESQQLKVTNKNYCATVVQVSDVTDISNCDNIRNATIFGNNVIVSKNTNVGDIGLYFPVETQLSAVYLHYNNLYSDKSLNSDETITGYMGTNGRVRCVKLRGNKSEGLFMPLSSLGFIGGLSPLDIGVEFDTIGGTEICRKYIIKEVKHNTIKQKKSRSDSGSGKNYSKIMGGQFRFHEDTLMLYKYLGSLKLTDNISITYKLHGTSGISSNILCHRKLSTIDKILSWFDIDINTSNYDNVYSSRKVIKNPYVDDGGYYDTDIWKLANDTIQDKLVKGMTAYYEIVGYLPNGKYIQEGYDYGCRLGSFDVYVYRLTMTNVDGKVFELPSHHVAIWCEKNDIKYVPELYNGTVRDFIVSNLNVIIPENWNDMFLNLIKSKYNEKDCYICKNKVPEEGCVIRVDNRLDITAYKCKSNRFYERETKQLDKGMTDIETEN